MILFYLNSRKYLIKYKSINENKIFHINNWTDIKNKSLKINNYCKKNYGIENKFVFIFGGILGPSQDIKYLCKIIIVSSLDNLVKGV